MPVNPTTDAASEQPSKTFLIGSLEATNSSLNCCPTASTLMCVELETGLDAVIAIPCRRWGCRHCGQRKAFGLAIRCEIANPNRFITLTVDPKRWITPRDAYDGTRRKLADFNKILKKRLKEFEYIRILEATKRGWPHYHLLARCPYIQQNEISQIWASLTGAAIVDIRRIDKGVNVFKYVLKYLCKQAYIPWTSRRVSWSRGFFPKPESSEPRQNPFVNRRRLPIHPAAALSDRFNGKTVQVRRPGVWVIEDSTTQVKPHVPYSGKD